MRVFCCSIQICLSVCMCATAVVTLKEEMGSEAAIAALNGKTFNDNKVEVKFNPCNKLLCVGNLPADMEDADFRSLVQSYGPTERCFLMQSSVGKYNIFSYVIHLPGTYIDNTHLLLIFDIIYCTGVGEQA